MSQRQINDERSGSARGTGHTLANGIATRVVSRMERGAARGGGAAVVDPWRRVCAKVRVLIAKPHWHRERRHASSVTETVWTDRCDVARKIKVKAKTRRLTNFRQKKSRAEPALEARSPARCAE